MDKQQLIKQRLQYKPFEWIDHSVEKAHELFLHLIEGHGKSKEDAARTALEYVANAAKGILGNFEKDSHD